MIYTALILHYEPDGWRIYDPTIGRDIPNAQGVMTFAHAWQAITFCYPHHYTFEVDTAKVSDRPAYTRTPTVQAQLDAALLEALQQEATTMQPTYTTLLAIASDMLAALEALQQGFMDGSIKFTHKRTSDSDPYHPANVLMCAAIAKATSIQVQVLDSIHDDYSECVAEGWGCPACQEMRMDYLAWDDDGEVITCLSCGEHFTLTTYDDDEEATR